MLRRCWALRALSGPPTVRRLHHALHPTLSRVVYEAEAAAAANPALDQRVEAHAWVASMRRQKTRTFLELTDGTLGGGKTVQAMVVGEVPGLAPGVAVRLEGRMRAGRGTKATQQVEMHVDAYDVLAESALATYPLAHLMHGQGSQGSQAQAADIVRRESHLKARTAHYGALSRTRSRMEHAMGTWFEREDFTKMHPPLITASDCEGGGEIFRVVADADVAARPTLAPADLTSFWSGTGAYLAVSTQLHLEAFALGLSRVYGLCPVFRAEGSATNRHLAEFWMCEAELCWVPTGAAGLEMVMAAAEGVVKAMVRYAAGMDASEGHDRHRQRAQDDMQLLLGADPHEVLTRQAGLAQRWPRMSYTDAVGTLRQHASDFTLPPPVWGEALRSEHERWLASQAGTPVFVTDYPSNLKPFYMRASAEDVLLTDALAPGHAGERRTTVACFDLLVPGVGELAGGSLREERKDVLEQRMRAQNLDPCADSIAWYTQDLRRYGGAPHGGYGLGMERLVSWVTHVENVRDIVGFPRIKGALRY